MRPARIFVALTLALAVSRVAKAQKYADDPRVQQALNVMKLWVDAQVAYQHLPAVSASVVKDQELVWSGGFGYADIARKVPATASTIYSICSISKLFTGVATMALSDAGKLSVNDPVEKYIPWFNIKQKYANGDPITIAQFMSHSSGLPRESDFAYWSGPDFYFPTFEELKAKLGSQETIAAPMTKNQYSNLAVSLEGWIDQAAAGTDYHTYVKKTIIDPLGLTSTTSEMPKDQIGKRLAIGYAPIHRWASRPALPFFEAKGTAPCCGFASTADDLAKFAMWQFRLLKTNKTEILKASSLREMQRVYFVDPNSGSTYGLSFVVSRRAEDGKTYVGHSGGCPGFSTDLRERPEDGIATIAMVNASDGGASAIATGIYDIVAPALLAVERERTAPAQLAGGRMGESNASTAAGDPKAVAPYTGYYISTFSNAETAVIPWGDGITMVTLGATGGRGATVPVVASLPRYKKTGEHTFTRIPSAGGGRGAGPAAPADAGTQEITFIMGAGGKATAYKDGFNRSERVVDQEFPAKSY